MERGKGKGKGGKMEGRKCDGKRSVLVINGLQLHHCVNMVVEIIILLNGNMMLEGS